MYLTMYSLMAALTAVCCQTTNCDLTSTAVKLAKSKWIDIDKSKKRLIILWLNLFYECQFRIINTLAHAHVISHSSVNENIFLFYSFKRFKSIYSLSKFNYIYSTQLFNIYTHTRVFPNSKVDNYIDITKVLCSILLRHYTWCYQLFSYIIFRLIGLSFSIHEVLEKYMTKSKSKLI